MVEGKKKTEETIERRSENGIEAELYERDQELWRKGMERSKERLVVYRKTVYAMGEGKKRWGGMSEELHRFWRRFRGGLLHGGRRRKYKWKKGMKYEWCGLEEGGVEHWVKRCREITEGRKVILKKCGEKLGGVSAVWREMSEEE